MWAKKGEHVAGADGQTPPSLSSSGGNNKGLIKDWGSVVNPLECGEGGLLGLDIPMTNLGEASAQFTLLF